MKLQVNQQAPVFATHDVYGREIALQALRGKKVYLSFERNAGCPVCNLRIHELLKHADYFSTRQVAVLLVYESTVEKMKDYLVDIRSPFYFIADLVRYIIIRRAAIFDIKCILILYFLL